MPVNSFKWKHHEGEIILKRCIFLTMLFGVVTALLSCTAK